jgi:hypothetical protein
MITPTFHFKTLEGYLEVSSEKSEILVRTLQKEVGSHSFDIYPYINRCTMDVICGEVFFLPSFGYLEIRVVLKPTFDQCKDFENSNAALLTIEFYFAHTVHDY